MLESEPKPDSVGNVVGGNDVSTPYHIEIDIGSCESCAGCVSVCPTQALEMRGLDLRCSDAKCIGCDLCVRFCPVVALELEEVPATA